MRHCKKRYGTISQATATWVLVVGLAVAVGGPAEGQQPVVPKFTKAVAAQANGYETAAVDADKALDAKLSELDERLKAPSFCANTTEYRMQLNTAVKMVADTRDKWDVYYSELVSAGKALQTQLSKTESESANLDKDFQAQLANVQTMKKKYEVLQGAGEEMEKARKEYASLIEIAEEELQQLKEVREAANSAASQRQKLAAVRGVFADTWALVQSSLRLYYNYRLIEVRDRYGLPIQNCVVGLGPRKL